MHGTSSSIVKFLIEQYPAAASIPDSDGKTPLHLAFINCRSITRSSNFVYFESRAPWIDVVEMCCRIAPSTITKEDVNGISPLEYAIMEEVEYCVVDKLQTCFQELMKPRNKTHGKENSDPSESNKYLGSLNTIFGKMSTLVEKKVCSQAA